MAITFVEAFTNPADNSSLLGSDGDPSISVAGSTAQAGDLAVLILNKQEGSPSAATILNAAGQSWNGANIGFDANPTAAIVPTSWWCTFNGTWSADPQVDVGINDAVQLVMGVFRPTSSSYVWDDESTVSGTTFASPGAGASTNLPGKRTSHISTVTLAFYATTNRPTWTPDTSTGFVAFPSNQYRNSATGKTKTCIHLMYKILTSADATGDVNSTQGALNKGPGGCQMSTWYEDPPVTVKVLGKTTILGKTTVL